MTDSNIISRLRKLRFNRRTSPPPDAPSIRSRTSSSGTNLTLSNPKRRPARIDIYHPLDISSREIRLLHILPEQPGSLLLGPDPIKCVLSHVSLDENPKYHALSYTWDDESLGESFEDPDAKGGRVMISGFIFLDGQTVEVTPNLWIALWHLRRGANWFLKNPDSQVSEFGDDLDLQEPTHFTYETPIWIDALCINQLNVLERNQQVQMMGSLYRNAQCVHAWLGLGFENMGLFIAMLNNLYEDFRERDEAHGELDRMFGDKSLEPQRKSLISICTRPYWNRLWVVQEFMLCQRCVLHFGLRTLGSTTLKWLLRILHDEIRLGLSVNEKTEIEFEIPVCATILARNEREISQLLLQSYTLTDFLTMFRDHKCTDPRDKVYAMLGLVTTAKYGIEVDYKLSADEVYKDVAQKVILADQSLHFICNPARYSCQCSESQHTQSPLPSWAVDFRCLQKTYTALLMGLHFNPTGAQSPDIFTFENRRVPVLACRGVLLGSIGRLHIMRKKVLDTDNELPILDLSLFAASAPESLQQQSEPHASSLAEHLRTLYRAITLGGQVAEAKSIDEVTFVQHCSSVLLHQQPLDNDLSMRIVYGLCHEAVFSLDLAAPASGCIKRTDPKGPIFGNCYEFCREGDTIAAIYGCPYIVALRPDPEDERRFRVLGEVYVHGFMNGEAVGMFEERLFELT